MTLELKHKFNQLIDEGNLNKSSVLRSLVEQWIKQQQGRS
ncbi:ribbon-helix-helix / copG family protein [Synechococcus sp. BIOS-E4-1]|nr:ribbon-helix-helix / copG family protein [Synechococcus sp. BIOS-E4-1]